MRRFLAILFGITVGGIVLASVLSASAQTGQTIIRVAGSDSMVARVNILSKLFMKNNPAVKVQVVEGSVEEAGLRELIDQKADVAMASRAMTEGENKYAIDKDAMLVERLQGYGGIVIIVHPENPLNELSEEQIRRIFKGEYTRWDQVGGRAESITVVRTDETDPGTLRFMVDVFLSGSAFTKAAVVLERFPGVMSKVARTPGAIGYVRIRDAFESRQAVKERFKHLNIRRLSALQAVPPSRESVADGSYPLKRPFYLYHNVNAKPEVREFVDFLVSKGWGPSPTP